MAIRIAKNEPKRKRGQILVMFAIAIAVIILFAGLAIDFGVAYTDKTALSRAVDAAALEGMRNLSQGSTIARQLATDTFNANVQALGTYAVAPTFSFVQNVDLYGNQSVTITGTVYWQPLFLRIVLPSTVPITEILDRGRAPLYMSLVLDQSYSMTQNGGSRALPPAVTHFVNQFDDSADHVAVVSFATVATRGVTMSSSPPFKTAVTTYVNSMTFTLQNPYTFAQTGLDNGLAQINSVSVPANAQKVIVFFTDGWPNMVQDSLNCTSGSGTRTTLNFTQCDSGDGSLGLCPSSFPLAVFTTSGGNTSCSSCTSYPSYTSSDPCYPAPAWMTFHSQQYNTNESVSMTNVSNEAFYRAEPGQHCAKSECYDLLDRTRYRDHQPGGRQVVPLSGRQRSERLFLQLESAARPSRVCTHLRSVGQVFQQIASKILLRITNSRPFVRGIAGCRRILIHLALSVEGICARAFGVLFSSTPD